MSQEVQNVLSRLASTGGNNENDDFIPSATFQGAKPGYYFGTSSQGTGYYLDVYQQQQQERLPRKKKSVQIAEDRNETKLLLEQAEAKASGQTVMELTPKGIQSASNALVKISNKNAMQRDRFPDDPQQYMNSELALYEQLTALHAVAANAELYKHLLGNEQLISTLVELLGHANSDVCAATVALFLEWIDPSEEDIIMEMGALGSRILSEAWETIVATLSRFQTSNNNDEDEKLKGIDNSLSLMENLLELDLITSLTGEAEQSAAAYMVKGSKIVSWLFEQLAAEDNADELIGRCMELLSFLAQKEDVFAQLNDWSQIPPYSAPRTSIVSDSDGNNSNKRQKLEPIDGIEILLQFIGAYRKKQPSNDQEVEMLENACVLLSSCISFSSTNLSAFLNGQGIELVLRCLKERVHTGVCGLKLLDFFSSGKESKQAAEYLVQKGGLKYLFPLFLGQNTPKPFGRKSKKAKRDWLSQIQTQLIRIFYALSRHLTEESPEDAKARFMSKFVQDDRKCDRLVELLLKYDEKSRQAEYNFYRSDVEDALGDEDTAVFAAMNAKLQGGGELFHRVGALTAYVCVNSKRCHQQILSQLQMQQSGISLVKSALRELDQVLADEKQKDQLESYLSNL